MATREEYEQLKAYARTDGAIVGGLWILSFAFFIGDFYNPLLGFLSLIVGAYSLVFASMRLRRYRDTALNGVISFRRALFYSMMIYFYAALLMAAAQFIYFQFIDQGFLMDMYRQQLNETMQMVQGDLANSMEQIMIAFDTVAALTPIQLTFQLISQNVFYGIVLSLPTALLTMRYKK